MSEALPLMGDVLDAAADGHGERLLLARKRAGVEGAISFRDFARRVRELAAGFLDAGYRTGDRVALFADNCSDWLWADQALAYAGLVSVPRGLDTANAELELILEHSGASGAILGVAGRIEELRTAEGLRVHGFGEGENSLEALRLRGADALREERGERLLGDAREAMSHASPLSIVYTSGTTGTPKGVVLSHGNVTGNVLASTEALALEPGQRMLSILPSWHMYERIKEYVAIHCGCTIYYTDQRGLRADLRRCKPELVAFVPRIWELLASAMRAKLEGLPLWKRALLAPFLAAGRRVARGRAAWPTRAFHRLGLRSVLAPVSAALGGHLRYGVSGGGALPDDVDEFLLSVGVPLLNGYGLTESSPVLTVRRLAGNRVGVVGPPLRDTEIRICAEDGREMPSGERGEILARGPQIMQGYYRDEALTRSVLSEDGWLATGDLGQMGPDGWLSVTGRLKDTIVLSGGENVEPDPIEAALRRSPWIEQVILVGQDQKQLGALIVPSTEQLAQEGLSLDRREEEGRIRQVLRGELDRILGKGSAFRPIDRVARFRIVPEAFRYENGLVTATLKLKRAAILGRFEREIRELYEGG